MEAIFNKYNLTIPQENIWMIEELNMNTNINNIFGTFRIKQKLDLRILNDVMNKIVETNDSLRIRINVENSVPYQYITEYKEEEIKTYILKDNNKKSIEKIINKISKQGFQILNNKLYDIQIIQNDDETCVCFKTHHIISDAWTLGQIAEQIKKFYLKIKNNEKIEVNPSYIKYINKDIKYKMTDKYLIDKEYWEDYVKELKCENNFEITKDKRSKRIQKIIDNENYNDIHSFCEKNQISEYIFFLAVIAIYFAKIFNKENIVIGTPFLNRRKADNELEMMGMFISTLPIKIDVKNEDSFIEMCKKINSITMQCFRHSKYPYFEIQKSYKEFSKENVNLYEIAFSYQINKLEIEINGDTGKTEWISNDNQVNPLLISYVNHFGEHILYYDYILKNFNKTEIDNAHDRIINIVKQIINNEKIKIERISILSDKDVKLLTEFNNTGTAIKTKETVVSRFNEIVSKNKNTIAVVYGNEKITYDELNHKINKLCSIIQELKIDKKAISIVLDKDIEYIISILAVIKSGNFYVPILPQEETKRMNYIIKDSNSEVVITNNKYYKKIEKKEVINLDEIDNEICKIIEKEILPEDVCYLIYTSGTTGYPKGVMIKNENIISLLNSMNLDDDLKFLKEDVTISLLKHSFDASTVDIYSALLNGGKLVLVPKEKEFDSSEVVKIIKKENVTRMFTVHKWIEQIQNVCVEKNITLDKLRIIGTGAEVLEPKKFERLLLKNPNLSIYNTYGPTETTVFVTKHKININDIKINTSTIGKLIPCTRAIIIDGNNRILPIGVKGEIAIYEDKKSVHNLAEGYYNKKNLTSERFIEIDNYFTKEKVKLYKTGDIAMINSNLELEFLGRKDDFIKVTGGYLISINEVEQRIKGLLGNNIESVVFPIQIKHATSLILFVSKKRESINVKNEEIKNLIDQNITFYMKPQYIIEINEIPRNKNGKIDRNELEKIALDYTNTKNEMIMPRTNLEQMIYDKVKKIVGDDFSITDDFEEELGLDSLNITNLYVSLNNSKMTIQDLYNYSSVQDLANMMKSEILEEKNKKINLKISNNSKKFDMSSVLLTGVTGFVGANMIKELAENEKVHKIYCIVRTKINLTSEERFINTIKQYFNEEICGIIKKKTVIIDGDLSKDKLGLSDKNLELITKNVKTIINCAANVKHIGKYNYFYRDNVKTVINIINLCKEYNINLAHISTLSLYGFKNKNTNKVFDENILNINQTFGKNPYLISKYEAEKKIIQEVTAQRINAKIFRIGNIMPRLSDGVFQINFEQNAFMMAIKKIKNIGFDNEEMMDSEIYLTPVDECVKAINLILDSDTNNLIYHIESDKKVKVSNIIKEIRKKEKTLRSIDVINFKEKLYENYNIGVEHLNEIIDKNANQYSKEITISILKKLNFEWDDLDENYLRNIVNIAFKIDDKEK